MRFLRSSKKSSFSDHEVIATYRQTADPEYLGILFERYAHLVFAVSMKYLKDEEDARDVVLSIFEKLGDDLRKYEIRNFGSWIYSVTRHYCLHESEKKKKTVRLDKPGYIPQPENEDEQNEFTRAQLIYLEQALAALNPDQHRCVKLFYLEEKSYQEICSLTGYSYNDVKTHIQNGKRNLRIYLEKKNNDKR